MVGGRWSVVGDGVAWDMTELEFTDVHAPDEAVSFPIHF